MRRALVRTLAVLAIAAGGVAVASVPASATENPNDPVCVLNQPTWLRAEPWGWVLRTLEPGRGFRVHLITGGNVYGNWYYGHSAEAPWQDGWIPAGNCNF